MHRKRMLSSTMVVVRQGCELERCASQDICDSVQRCFLQVRKPQSLQCRGPLALVMSTSLRRSCSCILQTRSSPQCGKVRGACCLHVRCISLSRSDTPFIPKPSHRNQAHLAHPALPSQRPLLQALLVFLLHRGVVVVVGGWGKNILGHGRPVLTMNIK